MTAVWPFMPVGDIVEALEWRTDIIRSKTAEQRIQLRARPRRQWQYRHVFTRHQHSAAAACLRGQTEIMVPDWTRMLYGGPVPSGSNVVITAATADLDLEVGGQVLVTTGLDAYEVCTLAAVGASSFTLASVATNWPSAAIWPLDAAHAGTPLQIARHAGGITHAGIEFDTAGVVDCGASVFSQYRGHDLLPDVPVVGDGELAEGLQNSLEVLDYAVGRVAALADRVMPDATYSMRWHAFTAADKRTLREWIFSRRGQLRAFWRSTYAHDLEAAAGILADGTTLTVFVPSGAIDLGETDFDIEIAGHAVYRSRVTAVSAGTPVSGRATLDLTLDSALGVAHTAAALGRISFLRCLRFNADRVEFLHSTGAGMAVAVPLIEVPVP